jgi:hypothetical protein
VNAFTHASVECASFSFGHAIAFPRVICVGDLSAVDLLLLLFQCDCMILSSSKESEATHESYSLE